MVGTESAERRRARRVKILSDQDGRLNRILGLANKESAATAVVGDRVGAAGNGSEPTAETAPAHAPARSDLSMAEEVHVSRAPYFELAPKSAYIDEEHDTGRHQDRSDPVGTLPGLDDPSSATPGLWGPQPRSEPGPRGTESQQRPPRGTRFAGNCFWIVLAVLTRALLASPYSWVSGNSAIGVFLVAFVTSKALSFRDVAQTDRRDKKDAILELVLKMVGARPAVVSRILVGKTFLTDLWRSFSLFFGVFLLVHLLLQVMKYHVALGTLFLKLLLVPYYTSTDFEVHRNWLAITHSLPLDKWYTEDTSPWTLDYPPLFAWFEWLLSHPAGILFDPGMLELTNLDYKSPQTLLFQRLSVIAADLLLILGVVACIRCVSPSSTISSKRSRNSSPTSTTADQDNLMVLVAANAGLVLVDHVHFQYNGMLFGLLLCSVAAVFAGNHVLAALLFAALLNMKHVFLYAAPAFFVYLFSTCCWPRTPSNVDDDPPGKSSLVKTWSGGLANLVKLGAAVLVVFGLSLGPFVALGQAGNVFRRLFPFKRGLTHAYWAPNFWALYNFADRTGAAALARLARTYPNLPASLAAVSNANSSTASGLVQESTFALLPGVAPAVTFAMTVAFMLPVLYKLWKKPGNPAGFLKAMVLCFFVSFMFGWHVHEKAILMVTIPWTVLATVGRAGEARHHPEQEFGGPTLFAFHSVLANVSLFPLLFRLEETGLKLALHCFHAAYVIYATSPSKGKGLFAGWTPPEVLYLACSVPVFLFPYASAVGIAGLETMEFLPLMIYSVYCAVGNVYTFAVLYKSYVLNLND